MSLNMRRKAFSLLRPTRKRVAAIVIMAATVGVYFSFFTPEKRAARHRLSEAEGQSKAAMEPRLKPVRDLFARGRSGARPFAKASLSWSGKWAMVQGLVDNQSHQKFLQEEFARHVFSPDELRGAIEAACRGYADDLDGVEGQMLVNLRADLADPDRPVTTLPRHLQSNEAFTQEYRALAERLSGQLRTDLGVSAGRLIAAEVAGNVASSAALQAVRAAAAEMGVSGGILAAGASSTVATLGVGLVLSFIIDYILDAVLKMAGHDPEAEIAATVVESLNKMESALLRDGGLARHIGLGSHGSLRVEFEKLHESRSKLRRETVDLMLKEGGGK